MSGNMERTRKWYGVPAKRGMRVLYTGCGKKEYGTIRMRGTATGQWGRARFHWLTARRSSIIQTSPVHTGRCTDAASALQHIMRRMVLCGPG